MFDENKSSDILFSYEGFVGNVFYDNHDMPKLIHDFDSNAKIIISLRSQFSIIYSHYAYLFLKSGYYNKFQQYVKAIIKNDKFNYYKTISEYLRYFDKESLLILYYEAMQKNIDAYLHSILKFIQISYCNLELPNHNINRSFDRYKIQLLRLNNYLFYNNPKIRDFARKNLINKFTKATYNLDMIISKYFPIKNELYHEVYNFYNVKNRLFIRDIDQTMSKYNYL